jgi:ankyrin repeat protein
MKPIQTTAAPRWQAGGQGNVGIAALLCLTLATSIPASAAAVDREMLYSKAEDLIRYTDDVRGLSALIAQGVDVRRPGKNSQGRTLLVSAATEGMVAMMEVLLRAGADPNAKDESGMTPLRQVAWTGKNQLAVTKRLIAAKADVNLVADDNWTPLIQIMYADPGVAVPVAQLLLQAGADASIVNNEGNTALMLAADRGMPVLIPALVKGGADINARGRDGTALGLAAEKGQTNVVKALLEAMRIPTWATRTTRRR